MASLLFTLYGVTLLCALVYYKFPYVDFVDYQMAKFGRTIPYEIKISGIEPLTPPVGIALSDVIVSYPPTAKGGPKRLAVIDRLTVKPSLVALVFGDLETGFKGTMFGGDVKGSIENSGASQSAQKIEASFQAVDLKKVEAAKTLWGLDMSGTADGNVSYSCADRRWWTGDGTARLNVRDGTVAGLRRYLIPLNKVDRCAVDGEFAVKNGTLTIRRAVMTSAQAKLDISGTAKLAQIPNQTSLDLTVTIELSDLGKTESRLPFDRMRVAIRGTPAMPKVRILSNK